MYSSIIMLSVCEETQPNSAYWAEGAYHLVRTEQYQTPLSGFLPLMKFGRRLWIKLVKMFSKSCAILLLSAAVCTAFTTDEVSLNDEYESSPRVFFANYTSSKYQVSLHITSQTRSINVPPPFIFILHRNIFNICFSRCFNEPIFSNKYLVVKYKLQVVTVECSLQ